MPEPAVHPVAAAHFLPGGRTVLLLHTLSDGSAHVDWLCESVTEADAADPDAHSLIAFRLPRPLHELLAGATLPAERLPDHRRSYLDYAGPVSRNRGDVTRLTAGTIVDSQPMPGDRLRLRIRWRESSDSSGIIMQTLELTPQPPHPPLHWLVHCEQRGIASE